MSKGLRNNFRNLSLEKTNLHVPAKFVNPANSPDDSRDILAPLLSHNFFQWLGVFIDIGRFYSTYCGLPFSNGLKSF